MLVSVQKSDQRLANLRRYSLLPEKLVRSWLRSAVQWHSPGFCAAPHPLWASGCVMAVLRSSTCSGPQWEADWVKTFISSNTMVLCAPQFCSFSVNETASSKLQLMVWALAFWLWVCKVQHKPVGKCTVQRATKISLYFKVLYALE